MSTTLERSTGGPAAAGPGAPAGDLEVAPIGRTRGLAGWLVQVVSWTFILSVLAVLAIALVLPRLGGATPYTVLTGSMEPRLPPGTLVVVKPVAAEDVVIGDVITFQLESGRSAVVTHRVIGVRPGVDGEPEFITQGDANAVPDADPVRAVQVRGRLWYAVPNLGRVNTILTGEQRQVAVYGCSVGLVLYAGVMFSGALRERRRRPQTP
jgi:signal peptidase